MRFRYRYVGFGTSFFVEKGPRPEDEHSPSKLYENELAVDVGGICLGHSHVEQHVIDHHFFREAGQFPSAAAAVLHLAHRIVASFGKKEGDLWLVTHRDPDFDAFCSMYLVRCLLEEGEDHIPATDWDRFGLRAEGWFQGHNGSRTDGLPPGVEPIDWFRPRTSGWPSDRRWPVLLAAYAAHVDNCRRLTCPKNRALHSILYAALQRGRDYYPSETSGALEFFREVTRKLRDDLMNPVFDSVLKGSPTFAPELALLDWEQEAYSRDIRRARRTLVFLQEAKVPFENWFSVVQGTRLLKGDGIPEAVQLQAPDQDRGLADGIYLRDPECLLFKEWARLDTEDSTLGRGYLFTAIAYSGGRRGARVNQTDYYFSLDPERAGSWHLYNVWARIQAAEALRYQGQPPSGPVRKGYEERARGYEAAFVDPWFDGSNFACTIVATPNRGTAIAEGGAAQDLSDDPVVQLVQQELELSVFASEVSILDLAASAAARPEAERSVPIARAMKDLPPPPRSYFRFARLALEVRVQTLEVGMAAQIGRVLWGVLDPDGSEGLPEEALTHHLVVDADSVSVWSRRGVVIAAKKDAAGRAKEVEDRFKELAAMGRDLEDLLEMAAASQPADDEHDVQRRARIERGERLMRRVIRLQHELVLPQYRVLRSFFEATGLSELLGQVHNVNAVELERAQAWRMDENIETVAAVQRTTHWIEIFLVSVYAVELFHALGESFRFHHDLVGWSVIAVAAFSVVASLWVVRPWTHGGISLRMLGFLTAMAVLLAVFVVLGMNFPREPEPLPSGPAAGRTDGTTRGVVAPERP
jgi:hypothetical protein